MSAGPFLWKPKLRAKEPVGVELTDDRVIITDEEGRREARFDEITGLYLLEHSLAPYAYSLIIEIELQDGDMLRLGYSTVGFARGENKRMAHGAVKEIFSHLANANPNVVVTFGTKANTRFQRWFTPLCLIVVYAYTWPVMLREAEPDFYWWTIGALIGVSIFLAAGLVFSLRKFLWPPVMTIEEAIARHRILKK